VHLTFQALLVVVFYSTYFSHRVGQLSRFSVFYSRFGWTKVGIRMPGGPWAESTNVVRSPTWVVCSAFMPSFDKMFTAKISVPCDNQPL